MFVGCPSDFTAQTDANSTTANVSWSEPTLSDNVGVVEQNQTAFPGTLYSLGVYTVTYTASDAAGNVAECSFNFTVEGK